MKSPLILVLLIDNKNAIVYPIYEYWKEIGSKLEYEKIAKKKKL